MEFPLDPRAFFNVDDFDRRRAREAHMRGEVYCGFGPHLWPEPISKPRTEAEILKSIEEGALRLRKYLDSTGRYPKSS